MKRRILWMLLSLALLSAAGCTHPAEPAISSVSTQNTSAVTEVVSSTETVSATYCTEAGVSSSAARSDETSPTVSGMASSAESVSATEGHASVSVGTTAPSRPSTVPTAATTTAISVMDTSTSPAPTADPRHITVTFSVDCHRAVEQGNRIARTIAPDGMLIPETQLTLDKGATVYDALKTCDLVVGAKSTAFGTYVYAIQSLAEKACGGQSGWLYQVNGAVLNTSCSNYILQDGDVVRWVYTCDSGKDV